MDIYRQNNLKIHSESMGQLVIQPQTADLEEISRSSVVLFPFRMNAAQVDVASEWASISQTPIFCHQSDIPKLENEGFGAYRFHNLAGYREVDFQGGALEFFPARRIRQNSWFGGVRELGELFELLPVFSFHIFIRPSAERSVLYLASPQLDRADILTFQKKKASIVIGAKDFPREKWKNLEARLGQEIIWQGDVELIHTSHNEKAFEVIQPAAETA